MAGVTGPISTLPGTKFAVPGNTPCDICGKPAVIRIQGETDSFGSEMHDLCIECANRRSEDLSGACDWCGVDTQVLRPVRDTDEGSCGPVYYVCLPCKHKQQQRDQEEYDALSALVVFEDTCCDIGDEEDY